MSIVTMEHLLNEAEKRKYAVGMFNFFNLESLESIIEAAEQKKSPVILGMILPLMQRAGVRDLVKLIRSLVERSQVCFAVHIDHGRDVSVLLELADSGITSMMYDGSLLPLQENISNTQEVVNQSRLYGITVEGELGYVGQAEGSASSGEIPALEFTNVSQAVEFTERTHVHALAIAVGNAHGMYARKPQLDFSRITQLHENVPAHLVLHGASGLPDNDIRKAVALGIRKVNFFTEQSMVFSRTFAELVRGDGTPRAYHHYMQDIRTAIRNTVMDKIDVLGSGNDW